MQGGEFRLNGVDLPDIPGIPLNLNNSVLTGVLADGSTFIFSNNSGDSLANFLLSSVEVPTVDLTPIVVNTSSTGLPSGLRAGQTLTLEEGGVLGNNFEVVDAFVNVNAGIVGDGFGAARSTVNIDGGSIGSSFDSHAGSIINVNGGNIGDDFAAHDGSVVNINAGVLGDGFVAGTGSEINISGGRLGQGFDTETGSLIRINGGTVGRGFDVQNSNVELSGGEFLLNGEAFTESTVSLGARDVFTGTLEDGSIFVFADRLSDRLIDVRLNQTTLPSIDLTPGFVSTAMENVLGLRAGQTLTLEQDGIIFGEFESAGGVINVNGGSFVDDTAFANTIVNLNEGLISGDAVALAGSELNLFGGAVADLVAGLGSEVNIYGGVFENRLIAVGGSTIDIFAAEFFFNGNEVDFIDFDSPLLIENRNFTLSGTFRDGSEFEYFVSSTSFGDLLVSSDATFQLNLVSVPEPSALFLLSLSGMMMLGKRRRV